MLFSFRYVLRGNRTGCTVTQSHRPVRKGTVTWTGTVRKSTVTWIGTVRKGTVTWTMAVRKCTVTWTGTAEHCQPPFTVVSHQSPFDCMYSPHRLAPCPAICHKCHHGAVRVTTAPRPVTYDHSLSLSLYGSHSGLTSYYLTRARP